MKKFTRLLSLLFFLQVVWSSTIYGQVVYSNDFSGGTVLGNTYTGTPTVNIKISSTQWTVTTGATLSNTGGTLLVTPLPNSGFATIKLAIKVKCGYKFTATGISFKHRRNIDGPSTAGLKVNANTIATINPVPTGTLTSYTSPAFTDDTWGETDIYFDLSGIGAPATGSYELDDFAVTGSVVADATLTNPSSLNLCAGSSASFSTTEANTSGGQLITPVIHWQKNSTGADVSTSNPYTINPIAAGDAGTYRAYVSYAVCTTVGTDNILGAGVITTPATLTVNPLPTATISGTTAVCQNATAPNITFTGAAGTAPYTFTYKVNGGPDQTVPTVSGNSVTVQQPTGTAGLFTYTLVSVADANCSQTQSGSATITVNALPTPSVSVTETSGTTPNDGILCAGASATLAAGTYTSYLWSANALSSTSSTVIVSSSGTYTVTVTNASGCTASASTTITVNPLPTPSVIITETSGTTPNDGILCTGASATLDAGVYSSYVWSTTATTQTISVSASTTYVVTVTDVNGCQNSASAIITVNALPTTTLSGNGSPSQFQACAGANLTISASPSYAGATWSVTGASASTASSTGAITLTGLINASTNTTATYTVTYNFTNGNGCSSSASQVITVNPSPSAGTLTPSIASPIPGLCEGNQTVNFTGTPSGGIGLLQNIWTSAPSGVLSLVPNNATAVGTSATDISNVNPTPYADATVTYRVLDQSTGCSSPSLTSVVRVYNTPSTSAAGPDQANCNSGSFTLAGNAPTVGTGLWTVVGSANGATITTPTSATSGVTGLTAGFSVTLRWTISNGPCTVSTDDVVLTNYVQPTASIATSGPIAVCNQLTNFTITATAPSVGTGVWSVTGSATIASSSGTSVTVTVTPGNTGAAVWTVTNGLASCSSSSSITITNSAPPATAVITSNPSIEQCVAGLFTVNAASPGAGGSGLWTITNGGPGTIQSPTSTTTLVTGVTIPPLAASVTTALAWTTSSPGCPNYSTASINLINYSQPTTANAGVDIAQCNTTSFTLAGNTPSIGTAVWTLVGSVTNGTISGLPTSVPAAPITLNRTSGANSSATLRWTITNGVCPASTDDVILRNDAPVTSNAGTNQTQCNTPTFTLAGSNPSPGTGVWTVVSGPGSVSSTSSATSGVTGVTAGSTLVLRWTVTNGQCSSSSTVSLTNDAPVTSDAGLAQTNCNTPTFTLAGSNPSPGTGTWTVVSGPGSVTAPSSPTSGVTGVTAGFTLVLRWTVTNGTCTASSTVSITNDALPTVANAGPDQIKCAAASFTLAGNTPSVGTGLWTIVGSANGASITTPTSPTTTVTGLTNNGTPITLRWTITNGLVCAPSFDDVVLKNNPAITVTLTPSPFPKMCPSGSPITLTPTISGGQGAGFYTTLAYNSPDVYSTLNQLFNLQSQATLTPHATPGTDLITFTVVDNAGCSASTVFSAVVVPPLAPAVTGNLSICAAAPSTNLSTVLTAAVNMGGSNSYSQYQWSITGGATLNTTTGTSVTVTAASAGTASVVFTVTDGMTGCSSSTTTVVTINANPTVSVASITNVSCFGGNNGAVSITPVGAPVITYAWSNSATTQNISTLTAGTYTVVITDGNSCKASTSATVTQPATALTATTSIVSPILCFGGSGSVTVTPAGGTPIYLYFWNNETANQTATGLTAGTYTVTVTDTNGCTASSTVTLTQPTQLTASAAVTSTYNGAQISCPTSTNGTITVTSSGGTGAKGYVITSGPVINTTGATSGIFTSLSAGAYVFTITDANSCSTTATATIIAPIAVSVSATSTPVACFGGSNGTATGVASNGTGTKTYTISGPVNTTGATSGTFTGLSQGTYTITATDANGCTGSTSVTVNQPSQLLSGIQAVGTYNGFNIACNGGQTGVAQATAFGGTSPYTYVFSAGTQSGGTTNPIVTGLFAGAIYVTVTDSHGCPASPSPAVVVLTQPTALTLAVNGTPTNPSCVINQGNSMNGSAAVLASGGQNSPPNYLYSYNWGSGVGNTPTANFNSGLAAGTYTVTVTDGNGCMATTNVVLTAPAPIVPVITGAPAAACSGGAVSLSVSGATSYTWATSSTGPTVTFSPASGSGASFGPVTVSQSGNQTTTSSAVFTVTAQSGSCSTTSSVSVTVNPLPYLTGVTSPDPICSDAGAFNFTFTGNNNGANSLTIGNPSPSLTGFPQTFAFAASPIGVVLPSPLTSNSYNLSYRVQNTTTGCFSDADPSLMTSPIVVVNVRPRPVATVLAITGPSELCDALPTSTLQVTTTGPNNTVVGAYPRQVLIQGPAGQFTITIPSTSDAAGTSSGTAAITVAGVYTVIGITDGTSCAGTITSSSTTLRDGRFTVTPSANSNTTGYVGCSVSMTANEVFTTPAFSSGTLSRQWQFKTSGGASPYSDLIGETGTTLTLTNLMLSQSGYVYRMKVIGTGACGGVDKYSGEVTLTVLPFTVSAGSNQTQAAATFNITGTPSVALTSGTWSVVSGSATIANTTSASTTVTLIPNTTATLRWSIVAGSCTGTADVVLTRQNIILDAKVFLEGPLSGGAMSINIRSILPATSPYGTGENSVVIPVISVTDWIKVELRNAITPSTLVEARSGLLMSNGKIVDMDGVSPITFNTASAGSYHIAVIHRNHIDFRTNTALSFAVGTPTVVDFTIAAPNVFNTALKLIGGTTSAMFAGDANGDNKVNLFDYLLWFSKNNTLSYPYSILSNSAANADFNLNPGVNLFDYLKWFSNNNINKSPNP